MMCIPMALPRAAAEVRARHGWEARPGVLVSRPRPDPWLSEGPQGSACTWGGREVVGSPPQRGGAQWRGVSPAKSCEPVGRWAQLLEGLPAHPSLFARSLALEAFKVPVFSIMWEQSE